MFSEDEEYRWSQDAVKDWAFAVLINAPFPIAILIANAVYHESASKAVWQFVGFGAAVAVVLAAGVPFAGRQSRIFTRVIDGVYVLALGQRFPVFQVGLVALSYVIWKGASQTWGMNGIGGPLLESYFIAFVYCQLSLVFSFFLGCVYRKPRDYPRWLRPWNHEFDRLNDTLTRR